MKPTNVTGYPFSNGDRLTAISVNQICNALDAIQDYNDTIKEFEDLVEENTEEIKSEIGTMTETAVSAVRGMDSVSLAIDVEDGKKEIAAAINAKGGTASATESFAELAEAVEEIPNFNTAGTEWVEGYTPTSLNEAYNFTYLKAITNTAITTLGSGTAITNSNLGFRGLLYLEYINLPNCTSIPYQCFNDMPALRELILPKVTIFAGPSGFAVTQLSGSGNIENLVLGRLVSTFFGISSSALTRLRNITVGDLTNADLIFYQWTATAVIAEGQTGIDELNENLYNNLLSNLYDHSQDGQTKTLRIGWLARVTAENIAYANAKGWTLTT